MLNIQSSSSKIIRCLQRGSARFCITETLCFYFLLFHILKIFLVPGMLQTFVFFICKTIQISLPTFCQSFSFSSPFSCVSSLLNLRLKYVSKVTADMVSQKAGSRNNSVRPSMCRVLVFEEQSCVTWEIIGKKLPQLKIQHNFSKILNES